MKVTPININNTRFLANNTFPTAEKEKYSYGKKAVVATTTALSVGTCLAIMAKKKKYNISKYLYKYLAKLGSILFSFNLDSPYLIKLFST